MILPRIKNFSDSTFKNVVVRGAAMDGARYAALGAGVFGGLSLIAGEDGRKEFIPNSLIGAAGGGIAGSILGGIYAYKHRYDKIDWDDAENSLTGKYDYDYKKFIMPKQNILPRDFIKLMGNQKKFIPEIIKEYVITKNPSSNLNIPVIGSLAPIYNGSKDIFLLKMANSDNAIFYNMDTRTYNYGSDKSFKSLKDILNDYYKNKENKDRLSREYIKFVNRVL